MYGGGGGSLLKGEQGVIQGEGGYPPLAPILPPLKFTFRY